MDIQIALNWAIQAVVMSFVSLLIFQCITGLFVEYNRAMSNDKPQSVYATIPAQIPTPIFTPTTAPEPTAPIIAFKPAPTPDPWQEPQLRELPDPWFTTDIQPTPIPSKPAVVLQFPTLRLLPPAAEVQPKARKTKKSTKSATPKTTAKSTNKAATTTRSKSRKSA